MSNLLTDHPLALKWLFEEDLYLVREPLSAIADSSSVKTDDRPEKVFDYLGENNKFILILVDEPGQKYAGSATVESLKKILNGVKLELSDVALINISGVPDSNFTSLKNFFACSRLVLFGIDPKSLELSELKSNEIVNVQGVKILATYSFEEMNVNDQKKRLFWSEMKKLL